MTTAMTTTDTAGPTAVPRWTGHPEPGRATHEAAVPPGLAAALDRLGRQLGVSRGILLLAAHARTLAALGGEDEVTTGYVAAPGKAPQPCRLTVAPPTWSALVRAAEKAAARRDGGAPVPETVLDPTGGDGRPDDATVLRVTATRDVLRLRYRTDVLDAQSAERIAGYHLNALRLMTADPRAEHGTQSLLSAGELRFQLDESAGPARELPPFRAHELFEQRARAHPDAVAVVQDGCRLTYRELDVRADRLAHALLAAGLRPGEAVAVVTGRTPQWPAAVLAVLKAGGVYLPVEPDFPPDRVAAMLTRASCRHALTGPGSSGALDRCGGVRNFPIDETCAAGTADTGPRVGVAAGDLAYVYFTSGSTGEPKGALCAHDGMLNHLYAKIDDLGIGERDVVAQIAPQCFDISLWQLLAALLTGGRTLLVGQEAVLDVRRFLDTIADGGVTVAQVVPSYLDAVLSCLERHPRDLPALRRVCVTGEALPKDLVRRWFAVMPDVPLVNAYGLTETSDDTNHEVLHGVPDIDRIPIGRPVNNVRVYVLDANLSPAPLGAPGEIAVSGVCVGRGYVGDPERTRQSFTVDPYHPGERLHRNGDRGRWLPGGRLEFLGRRDTQVKINGFRIETGEVEDALREVPGVRDGAVVVARDGGRGPHLVAFCAGPRPVPDAELRERLGRRLPAYMVPTVVRWREELPLTANGKTDRKALTALAGPVGREGGRPPMTPTERRLAAAWSAALGVPEDRIGRRDSFADHGGTSLTAVKVVVALDRAVSLRDVGRRPVLADLAALLDDRTTPPQDASTTRHREENTMPTTTPPFAPGPETRPAAPPLLRADTDDAAAWAGGRRDDLLAAVTDHGSLLVRGLGLRDTDGLRAVRDALRLAPVAEREPFAARHAHAGGVYSSTPWPQNQPMCMHHELSHTREFPRLMLFGCLRAPTEGGATAVADSAAVFDALPARLTERFEREGWLLTRTYNGEIGASVTEAFGTDDPAAVEAYCRANAIRCAWQPDGTLRTWQRRSAVARHPLTGRRCWFNQVAFLSEWTMAPEVREFLVDEYGADGLPFTTRFGDGTPVTEDVVDLIGDAYASATVREPWQDGDLLLVDNVRTAHAREPYSGPREIAVAMAGPLHPADITPDTEVTDL